MDRPRSITSRKLRILLLSFLCTFPLFPSISFAFPRIIMTVSDTTAHPYETNGQLNVYMANYNDIIEGFQFVVKTARPDIMKFRFTLDTIGTLTGGFEYMQAINRANDSTEFWFRCIADNPFVSGHHPGIPIQPGGLVMRIPFRTFGIPAESLGMRCEVIFDKPTDFSDPSGNSIGAYVCPQYDTSYWRCLEYSEELDTCVHWEEVTDTSEGYDFMYIDTTNFGCLDPAIVLIDEGAITLSPITCDNNNSGSVTIQDLTCLVSHLFISPYPANCPTMYCDANHSGGMNIHDLVYLVKYLFAGGPPPL